MSKTTSTKAKKNDSETKSEASKTAAEKAQTRSTKTKSNGKRILVLCGHEPTLDPRIEWAGRAAGKEGYNVWVHGWTEGHAPPKGKDPKTYKTTRANSESPAIPWPELKSLMLQQKVIPFWLVILAIFGTALKIAFLVIYRLILAPWVVLDYALEMLKIEKFTTRPIENFVAITRNRLFWFADKITGGRIHAYLEGITGYKWYIAQHALQICANLLHTVETQGWAPDVIHANDPDTLLAAVMLKRMYNCRVIYDAHEYGPEAYLMEPRPKWIFFLYEKLMLKWVDATVTVTPQIADKFHARYKNKTFYVVPNASPLPARIPKYMDTAMEDAAKGRVRFLYHGGFAVNRGIEEIIDEWKLVDTDAAVLFIRGPENNYKQVLLDHAKKTGLLGESVFFLDSIAEDKLIASAKNVDVGIIPYLSSVENHAGACPNKLSQYMHAGVAVLSNDLPFVASVVKAAKCGKLYADTKPGDFARQVNAMAVSPGEIKTFSKNGKKYGREIYNYETYYQTLSSLYQNRTIDYTPPHAKMVDNTHA